MDKYEKLQETFHAALHDLVNRKILKESDAEIVRQTFNVCAHRINKVEIQNIIDFAKSEEMI